MKSASTIVIALVGNALPTDAVKLGSSNSAPGYTKRSLVEDEGQGVGNWHGWTENNKHSLMTLEKCSELCNKKEGCNSFTFKPEKDNGWCHLKAKCVDEHTAAKIVAIDLYSSWYKESSQGVWKQRTLVANEGKNLELFSASLGDCQARCDKHPQCKSVSFKGDESKCKLHDKVVSPKDEAKPQVSAYNTYYRPCAPTNTHAASLVSKNWFQTLVASTGLDKKAQASAVKRVIGKNVASTGLDKKTKASVVKRLSSKSVASTALDKNAKVSDVKRLVSKNAASAGLDKKVKASVLKRLMSKDVISTGLDKKARASFVKRSLVAEEGSSLGDYHGWWTDHNTHKAMTIDQCQKLCAATKGCNSITFKPEKDYGWCHLKSMCVDERTPAKTFPIDVFSAWYKDSGEPTWSKRSLVADEGNNLNIYGSFTLAACKDMCKANDACKSITFGGNKSSEFAFCLLKDKSVPAGASGSVTKTAHEYKTYFLSGGSRQGSWQQRGSVADQGQTLQMLSVNLSECQAKCDENHQCNSISFRADDSTCKLQEKVISSKSQAKEEHSAYSTYYRPC